MNKLQQLLAWLDLSQVSQTQTYIYFQTSDGEPQTVVVNEQKQLVVSGPNVGGPLHHFTDVILCVQHIQSLNPHVIY